MKYLKKSKKKLSHSKLLMLSKRKGYSFSNQKLKHAKLKFNQKKVFDNISLYFMKILLDKICHTSLHTNT